MEEQIENRLGELREGRGLSAAELARRTGVSRQTIYAIEGGSYVPNTVVSLRLAAALEVSVEEIFRLGSEEVAGGTRTKAEVLSAGPVEAGQAVRICRVGEKQVAVPTQAAPYYLPDADGVLLKMGRSGIGEVVTLAGGAKRVLVAGCDPAIGYVAAALARDEGVELVGAAASSRLALEWLKAGKVDVAGTHLRDAATGEFNLPYLRREFAGEELTVVTFAHWEEGLVLGPGRGEKKIEDLARQGVRIVNREAGSGSRALLDRLLGEAGIEEKKIKGYERVAHGHLAAAYQVYQGEADCCVATRAAAQAFGLGFVALERERYDFVLRKESLGLPAVRAMMEALQRSALRRKLEMQAGYETGQTGVRLV